MEQFVCKTMIVSGEGALQVLAEGKNRRIAVVTEQHWVQSGLVRKILNQTKCQESIVLGEICAVPTVRQAMEGAGKLRDFRPEGILAVGGGNVMDCAKAMRCFAKESCALTVIPMALGTGTEVTDTVSLFHERCRHTLRHEAMRPDRVILDSGLLEQLPRGQLIEGGFSLLAASLESYTGKRTGCLSAIHAREAFTGAFAALPAAFGGNPGAIRRVQTASVMASMARDQSGSGLCAALCSSMESVLQLSRGRLAGILLPAVVGCNAYACGSRYAELARAAGMGGSSDTAGARNLRAGLQRLRRELGLPGTLSQAGIDLRRVRNCTGKIVQLTLEDPECRNNPVAVDDFMVRRILEEVMGRY